MIKYLLGSALVVFLIFLVIGGLTGRVRMQNCCSIADPERDLRMGIPEGSAAGTENS